MARRRGKGEGCISKRSNGSYRAYVHGEDGQRLHFSAKTKKECQDWIHDMISKQNGGVILSRSEDTLESYLAEWLEIKRGEVRPSTFISYYRYCKLDIIPALGRMKLDELRATHLNKFFRKLHSDGRGINTIKYEYRVFRAALNDARKKRLIAFNPIEGVTLPKSEESYTTESLEKANGDKVLYNEDEKGDQVYSSGELEQLFITARELGQEAIITLAARYGLRVGELLGLSIDDIEFYDDYAMIKINKQAQYIQKYGNLISPVKTRAGKREVRVGSHTATLIREHIELLEYCMAPHKEKWEKFGKLVFPTSVGTPKNRSNWHKKWKEIVAKSGLTYIRFHDLRHTAASIMLSRGIPFLVVSGVLGHNDPTTTLRYYAHYIPKEAIDVSNIMG